MDDRRILTEELLVQGTKLVWDLTGIRPVIGHIEFSYPEPPHRDLYENYFRCPMAFDAPNTIFHVLSPELDAAIQTMNEDIFAICTQHCRDVMRFIPQAGQLRGRIRSIFLTKPDDLPDLGQASTLLDMSVSTLRRQLESEHTSYQIL